MRQGTSANTRGEQGFNPVGNPAEVNVTERPITNQGLGGIKTGVKGTGTKRTVQENSYYLNLILGKQTEIEKEIQKFSLEMGDLEKEQANYIQLERKQESVLKTVRNLEGELADQNLTLDKMRTDSRVEDVNMMLDHIRQQNNKQRQILDNLFVERKGHEEKLMAFEHQIQAFNVESEKRLNDLDPYQRQEYENLMNDNNALQMEIARKRQEIEEQAQSIVQMDQRLRLDVQRQKTKNLKEERAEALSKNEELRMQIGELNLPLDELKEKFVTKIKVETDNVKAMEDRAKDLKKMIDTYSKQLMDMEAQAKNKDAKSENEKQELLMNKDREINEFLSKFEGEKQNDEQEIARLQDKVEQTLEELSKVCDHIDNIPDENKAKEIRGELDFKKDRAEETIFTLEKLKIEKERLNKEMNKQQLIDRRLVSEIENQQQRLQQMDEEISTKFNRVDEIKQGLEKTLSQQKLKKDFLNKKREYLLNSVRQVNMKFETKKQVLNDNNTYKNLMEGENKICANQAHILSMKQYIEYKQAETNQYDQIEEVNSLTAQINEIVLQLAQLD